MRNTIQSRKRNYPTIRSYAFKDPTSKFREQVEYEVEAIISRCIVSPKMIEEKSSEVIEKVKEELKLLITSNIALRELINNTKDGH